MVRCPPRHDRYSALLLHRLLSGVDVEYRSLARCRSGGNRSCPEPLHGGLRLRTSGIWPTSVVCSRTSLDRLLYSSRYSNPTSLAALRAAKLDFTGPPHQPTTPVTEVVYYCEPLKVRLATRSTLSGVTKLGPVRISPFCNMEPYFA
jgi:hypothetical protein